MNKYLAMKQSKKALLLSLSLFMITALFLSCGKCSNKSVGQSFCNHSYDEWLDADIIKGSTNSFNFQNSPHIIRNQDEYDTIMGDRKPFEVDFDKYSLLGVGGGGYGQSINSISWVCRNAETDEVIMYVKYSMENQCAGSGVFSIPYVYWAKVPKLSPEAKVYFEKIDVNPYDD